MRHRVRAIALLVLLGAVVTVAVAWASALLVDLSAAPVIQGSAFDGRVLWTVQTSHGFAGTRVRWVRETGLAWAAEQATGPPDTQQSGDITTAWASASPDSAAEWLQLDYDPPAANPVAVRIYESYNPGAVVKVTLTNARGTARVAWAGPATPNGPFVTLPGGVAVKTIPLTPEQPSQQSPPPAGLLPHNSSSREPATSQPSPPPRGSFPQDSASHPPRSSPPAQSAPPSLPSPIARVRLDLDSPAVPGWNEIDAVGVQDAGGTMHWARRATASSTYAAASRPIGGDISALLPRWARSSLPPPPPTDAAVPPQANRREQTLEARGWPMAALMGSPGTADQPTLPLRPIAAGFAGDVLLFAAALALAAWLSSRPARLLTEAFRARRGYCPQCGYDLQFDLLHGCPECGWRRGVPAPPTTPVATTDGADAAPSPGVS